MTAAADRDEQAQQPESAADQQEDLLALLQRERADFLNYKRRAGQERAEERQRARADLLVELLPLLDDLDRALTQVPEAMAEQPWPKGVLLSRRRLLDFLARAGVETTGAEGEPFDPTNHEALFYEERPGAGPPRVANVVRPGYRLGGRVLRPAQVGVVGSPDDEAGGITAEPPGNDRVAGTKD
jgi:molecular chaperone GrpE